MSNERYEGTFFEYFSGMNDSRQEGKVYHNLTDILFIVVSGVLCGFDEWDDIYTWANVPATEAWLGKHLALVHGIPSLSTIKRALAMIKPEEFSSRFIDWMSGTFAVADKDIVSIDGKTSRGSKGKDQRALHTVGALCHSHGLIIGQVKTEEKSNEITAIPALLEQLMIKGCIVTIDAMGAQKKVVEHIVKQNKADYVIHLKGNQGTLHQEVQTFFAQAEQTGELTESDSIQRQQTYEKNHGREEKRTYWYTTNPVGNMEAAADWTNLIGIGMVQREITKMANPTHTTKETAYFIGSIDSVADFARAARNHWGIESMHWSLDVTFRDDHNKTLDLAAAHNLAIVKRMVFNVLKNETKIKPKLSKPNKRIVAALDLDYRDHLIGQAFTQM